MLSTHGVPSYLSSCTGEPLSCIASSDSAPGTPSLSGDDGPLLYEGVIKTYL